MDHCHTFTRLVFGALDAASQLWEFFGAPLTFSPTNLDRQAVLLFNKYRFAEINRRSRSHQHLLLDVFNLGTCIARALRRGLVGSALED